MAFASPLAVGTMPSWCVSAGRGWMARGCADSEQLVSVSSWVWARTLGGLKDSFSTLVSQAPYRAHFLSVGQQWGWLSWFHLSSCDNGHSFLLDDHCETASLQSFAPVVLSVFSFVSCSDQLFEHLYTLWGTRSWNKAAQLTMSEYK